MTNISRGDVVVVDLGMTAKTRPCVVVSIGQPDHQRNMSVVWLRQESVVNVLGIAGVDNAKIERRLAAFPAHKMLEIESDLKRVLGL